MYFILLVGVEIGVCWRLLVGLVYVEVGGLFFVRWIDVRVEVVLGRLVKYDCSLVVEVVLRGFLIIGIKFCLIGV